MKRILITGVSGYIGSHLSEKLREKYQLIGLDILLPQTLLADHILNDLRHLYKISYRIDTIIHLAAKVKVNESITKPAEYYETNLQGTINLLKTIPCNNFIFASTGCAEYCNNPYGISKKAAEDCVREFCSQNNIPYTIFRFYNVIGSNGFAPTNPDGLFYNLIRATKTGKFTIFGNDYNTLDGTAERDYVHVDEICEAIAMAIETPSNHIENLGHGQGQSVKQIVKLFQHVNQTTFDIEYAPRRSGDLERSILDKPSVYLPNLYSIEDLLVVPKNLLQ
ncbi:MAG: hypothetical protein RLZZ196_707 [Bacteroidota bacterium]|jgi:UDP-glucose 4-epimerase